MGATTIATGDAQQRQQGVDTQSPGRGFAENMQPVADLRLFEVAQIGVQTRQPNSRIGVAVEVVVQLQLAINVGVAHQLENIALQFTGAARVEQLRLVIFIGQQFQITQRAVGFGAGQRRHQVVDDHRLGAPLGLCALARVVDDKRVNIGQRAEYRIRPALLRQADAFARQPLQIAVFAHVHHGMGAIGVAQPEVKRQIPVRRHQIRVVIHRAGVHLITPGRLNADKGQTKTQPGNHHAATAKHRIVVRRAPALVHGLAIGFGQLIEHRPVFIQAQTLMAGPQVKAVQIVADPAQQFLNQRCARRWQVVLQRITLSL